MKRVLGTVTIIALLALGVVLFMTNPSQSGPIGILAVFICLYVVLAGTFSFLIYFGSVLLARFLPRLLTRRPYEKLNLLHSYYYASVIALAPLMIIGMNSVEKVGFREQALVVIFVIAACVYIRKMTTK